MKTLADFSRALFLRGCGVLLIIIGGAVSSLASDTNVFLVKSTLTGNILSNTVRAVKAADINNILIGGTANVQVALSIRDFDDQPTGPRPIVELVLFNPTTDAIVTTLARFDMTAADAVPLYGGSRTVVAQVKGVAVAGLVDANLDAKISYTRTDDGPTKLTVEPLGAVTYNDGTDHKLVILGGRLQASGSATVVP